VRFPVLSWEEMEIKGDKVEREKEMVREMRGEGDI
jgi:hypothetical protein